MKKNFEDEIVCPHKNMQGRCKMMANKVYICLPMNQLVCTFYANYCENIKKIKIKKIKP